MPTKRTRRARGITMTPLTEIILGLGAGIHSMPAEELRDLWLAHGAQVTRTWQALYGAEPFVARIAREEGWHAD